MQLLQRRPRRRRRDPRRRAQHHAGGGRGAGRRPDLPHAPPSRPAPTTSAGGLPANLFAAAQFNQELGEIETVQPEAGLHRRGQPDVRRRRRRMTLTAPMADRDAPAVAGRPGARASTASRTATRSRGGDVVALAGIDLDDRGRGVRDDRRAERLRQDDAAAARRRVPRTRPRAPSRSAARRSPGPGRERGVVFQHPTSLYPWLSVRGNVELGLRLRGVAERPSAAPGRSPSSSGSGSPTSPSGAPYELSGGMQQRCQIARVLANDPDVMLMDEPFGAVDALTRERLQERAQRELWRDDRPHRHLHHPQRRRGRAARLTRPRA